MPTSQPPPSTVSPEPGPVRVFISYSHDSPEHMERVLALAQRLRQDGVDCRLDRFEAAPSEGWPLWAEAQVEQARFVLLVCTATYRRRFLGLEEADRGQGVVWEANCIRNDLYRQSARSSRYVPVFFAGDESHVPGPVGHLSRYDLDAAYEPLYWRLTDQPEVQPVALGPVRRRPAVATLPTRSTGVAAEERRIDPAAEREPEPTYASAHHRQLAERLRALQLTREQCGPQPPDPVLDRQILELRRQLRETGLQAGDLLGEGRYSLVEPIGSGGFATVWKAYDRTSRRLVAIKVLHAQYAQDGTKRERFLRGARQMAKLSHPGIVRVLAERGEEGGLCWFVMEYLVGGDLRQAVLGRRVQPEQAIPLGLALGEALQHAHEQGLVHRDVKPANVLLDAEGRPRLTDFDLVRAADTTGGTRTGALGTFLYAAPEALEHARDADGRADVFSLAMTIVFVLQGHELTTETFRRPERTVARLPCSGRIRQLLLRALDWDPAMRHRTVREFCDALQAAAGAPTAAAGKRWQWVVLGILLVLGVMGLGIWWAGQDRTPSTPDAGKPDRPPVTTSTPVPVKPDRSEVTSPDGGLPGTVVSVDPIRTILHGTAPRPARIRSLLELARGTRDLPTLQLAGAALLALGAEAAELHEIRARAGGALALGLPDPPWAEIPAGSFQMGSPPTEAGRFENEGPPHLVRITQPFRLLATEVTQALYLVVTGENPSDFQGDLRHPVEQVTWDEAVAFCATLSRLLGRTVRLPREAEWEYAARAGTTTRYWSGDTEADLARVGWYGANSGGRTHPVGEQPANAWGLYDVHGNVWEWCQDPWVGSFRGREAGVVLDPALSLEPGERGVDRVVRGGSWSRSARVVRSAYRGGSDPGNRWRRQGFRVLLPPSRLPAMDGGS